MTLHSLQQTETLHEVIKSEASKAFMAIHNHHVEGVIWDRTLPHSVQSHIEKIQNLWDMQSRFYGPVNAVAKTVETLFKEKGISDSPAQNWLVNDIEMLAIQMGTILSASELQLRLEYINDDACRRFHRDNVKARLICTYFGPGTEYGFARPGTQPNSMKSVSIGQPILLKGKLWSKAVDPVLLHRSPPIEGTGQTRLVLVIDDVSNSYPILD